MKHKHYYSILLFFLSFFGFSQTLDQSNAPIGSGGGGFTVSTTQNVGQSFTAGLTGNLAKVNIYNYSTSTTGDFRLTIYNGEGYGGSILGTQNFTIATAPVGEYEIPISTTINITAGNVYTFRLDGITTGDGVFLGPGGSTGPYANGILYYGSGSSFSAYDLWFKTFVNVPSPATHLNFDGVNDNITLGTNICNTFSEGSAITIEYWFKGTDLESGLRLQGDNGFIVAGWGGSANPSFIISTDGGTNGVSCGPSSVIQDNTWHHFAFVWEKNNIFASYLDGVLQDFRTAANVNLPVIANDLGRIGSHVGSQEFLNGSIDEVRIWSIARTATQINASKNCELQGNETGLVAYYKFNQGIDQANNTAISTLTDATSNANNGSLVNFALNGTNSNWLAGSPVTSGSTIPSAPTASDQTFCSASTINDLVPAPSATTKWYNSATSTSALNPTDALVTGTYYVASVNAAGCESNRVAVAVTVSIFTVTITSQTNVTCNGGNDGSVSLSVSGGVGPYTILWDDGTAYAFTRNNLIAGTYRAWITDDAGCTDYIIGGGGTLVTITEPAALTAPTVISPVVYNQGDVAVALTATSSGSGLLWYTTATGGTGSATAPTPSTATVGSTSYWVSSTSSASCESSSRSEIVVSINANTNAPTTTWSTQVYTGDDKDLTVLSVSGNSLKWYDAATGGNLLPNTTLLVDETTYYVSQTIGGVESSNRLAITVNKISENTQLLPPASTVADLIATPTSGTTAQWFTAVTGGTPLASTDVLTNGTYYVEQFIGTSIETLGSGIYAPYGVAVQTDGKILIADSYNYAIKRMDADGTNIVTLGSGFDTPTGVAVQADGKILIADFGNSAIKRMDDNGTNIVTLGSDFYLPYGLAVQVDGKILIADTYNNAIKRMDADGTNIVTLGSGFNFPNGVAVQTDGKILVSDTGNNSIKRITEASPSNRVPVDVDVTTLSNEGFEKDTFTIYPNPTTGLFTIQTRDNTKVEVYDISGRLILIENVPNTKTLSIENQAAGIFIVKVKSESGAVKSFKLIKR